MSEFMDKLIRRQTTWEPLPEDSDLEQFFTDAEYALQVFEELVTADRLPKRLLVIHGVGGVGKSTLLKMYRLSCYRRGIPVALVGAEDAPSSVDVLASWTEDLSNMGVRLRSFTKSLDHYRALQSKVEAKAEKAKEAMRGAAGELGKAAAKTAVEMAASTIPVIGPLVAALGGMGTEAAIDWLRGFLSKPDLDFYLDPSKRLTDDFLSDLIRAAARQRTVLMADTYEQMTALGDWMRNLTRRLPNNALLVIAGRVMPEWDRSWTGWMGQAEIVELKEMTLDDQRTLVRRYYAYIRGGEPDPEQVDAIVRFARGLPIAATTVVRLWVRHGVEDFHTVKAQVVADLADRLLEGAPPEMRPVFEAVAVLRYFNADSLRALLDDRDADALHAELRRWPFIRPRREGLAVHDTMREMVNEALRMRTPERFRTLNERAATHYEARLGNAMVGERERLTLERLYHRLRADEPKGTQLLVEICEELANAHFVERLRTVVGETRGILFANEANRLWLDYFTARLLQLEAKGTLAEHAYESVANHVQAEPRLKAYALCDLGGMLARWQYLGKPGGIVNATRVLGQSLNLVNLDSHLVNSLFGFAHVYQYSGKWDESLTYLEKAKQFYAERQNNHGLAYTYTQFEVMYLHMGELKGYLSSERQATAILSELPHNPFLRARVSTNAWVWSLAGRYTESEQRARECLTTMRHLGDSRGCLEPLRSLSWALAMQGKYDEANACCIEHFDIAQKLGEYYIKDAAHGMDTYGMVLTRKGRYDEATAQLTQSLEIKKDLQEIVWIPRTLALLGMLHETQCHWDDALSCYQDSLQMNKVNQRYYKSQALVGVCRVKHNQGVFADIATAAAEAEQLAQKHEFNDHMALLRLIQGHTVWQGHVHEWGNGFDVTLSQYQQALIYSLRYNRFLLDEVLWGGGITTPLRSIIPHCLARDEEGRQMLVALRTWWQSGANDIGAPRPDTISPIPEGISLLEAERIAREREPGDGSPQASVVERIDRALKVTTVSKGEIGNEIHQT